MPLDKDLKKVMVVGSGPIVIGQAAEFDYAGTQACRALKEEGLTVVLVNSNPATIMTDKAMADRVYIEPLTVDVLKRIIKAEKPDGLLSTLGGQTGLTLSMQLAKGGFLEENGVRLLGARPETIDKAEDRRLFKETMEKIGQPCIPSDVVNTLEGALRLAGEIGYPVIVRPAFTLGGSGGGIAANESELSEIAARGLRLSPITQVLIEKSVSGWKEIEFEVVRDGAGNVAAVCSMENMDPVGVHTGDSIVVAPCVTLSDREYGLLRSAALDIVSELKVEGGCNCQFALHPESFEYKVIEVNPRVSRSSALASKATGYPIAKVAAKIAIGYRLDEIPNALTGKTCAFFEPAIDYLVVKFPKWPFDKFVYARRTLGTQMKATGEVMAIGSSFEQALMKAVRGLELGLETLNLPKLKPLSNSEVKALLYNCDNERAFVIYEALLRGIDIETIHNITGIDPWFISKLQSLLETEAALKAGLTDEVYREAKRKGFLDSSIREISGQKNLPSRAPSYKTVDTCAGEFSAKASYFYSSFDDESEARPAAGESVIVLGSGPIRIGQGIEFDYCSVHAVWAIKKAGLGAVILNNNPETVSTDFDTGDRLYFDPLTAEDVLGVIAAENPKGVMVQFGGQTAIKLTRRLSEAGVKILGTSPDSIDAAEDRERFDALLEKHEIPRPAGLTVFTSEEAVAAAEKLGYPVLIRPSYVLGGQNMVIAHNANDIMEYMEIITEDKLENPVLVDKYLTGTEVEVDAVCDGRDLLVPGIMEHIERAGVHSGDSISVYPPQTLSPEIIDTIMDYTRKLAKGLDVLGLVNIQFVIHAGKVYVIEVNPRSSRTIPYISKVTGVPLVELATRAALGERLSDMGYGTGLYKQSPYTAVKVPVFSFEKLSDVDSHLGPEMKSTGEVLGIAKNFDEALLKGLVAAGNKLKKQGGIFITVRDSDKPAILDVAKKFDKLGFDIYATQGTAKLLNSGMVPANLIKKIGEAEYNTLTLIESGKVDYVISTSSDGRKSASDSVKIRRKAVEMSIPCLTSTDTANALADCLLMQKNMDSVELVCLNEI